jgi:hypothetical protein
MRHGSLTSGGAGSSQANRQQYAGLVEVYEGWRRRQRSGGWDVPHRRPELSVEETAVRIVRFADGAARRNRTALSEQFFDAGAQAARERRTPSGVGRSGTSVSLPAYCRSMCC